MAARIVSTKVAGIAALILCVGVVAAYARAQVSRKPLSKAAVIGLLKGDASSNCVAEMARERGIDFEVTPAVEGQLRQAGATETLLATLREVDPAARARRHVGRGVELGRKGDWDGAIPEAKEAIRLKPEYLNAHRLLGFALGKKGDWDGEIAEYREAIRLKPDSAMAHIVLGVALEGKGDRPAALNEYRKAFELDPKNSTARDNYERLRKDLNK